MGHCRIIRIKDSTTPINRDRDNRTDDSYLFFLPYAWAVNPLVPILKKPNPQKIIWKIIFPMAMAPRYFSDFKCPIMPISINPRRGMLIFEIILGMANENIFLFTTFSFELSKVNDCLYSRNYLK